MALERDMDIFEEQLSNISEGEISRDPDGDYVINYGGARFYARMIGAVNSVVQVFSVAAADVQATPDLLNYINEINRDYAFVRTFHVQNQVLVESDIFTSELTSARFHTACRHIANISDEISGNLVEKFKAKPRWQLGKQMNYAFGSDEMI